MFEVVDSCETSTPIYKISRRLTPRCSFPWGDRGSSSRT